MSPLINAADRLRRVVDGLPRGEPLRSGGWLAAAGVVVAWFGVWALMFSFVGVYPTIDDHFRLYTARFGLGDPSFHGTMAYWPPLPTIAAWIALGFGSAEPRFWLATISQPIVLAAAVGWWAFEGRRRRSDLDGGAWSAVLVLAIPALLRTTGSVLSEPLFVAGLICCWIAMRPAAGEASLRWRTVVFTGGGIVACASRYDAWPIVAIWGVCIAARSSIGRPTLDRSWWIAWSSSASVLAAIVLGWLGVNQQFAGSWRNPFTFADWLSLDLTAEQRLALAWRSTVLAAPLLVILGVAGLALAASRRRWFDMAIIAAPSVPFGLILATDTVGHVWPERFAIGTMLVAAIAGGRILLVASASARWGRASAAVLAAAAVATAIHGSITFTPDAQTANLHAEPYSLAREHIPPRSRVLVFSHVENHGRLFFSAALPPSRILLTTHWDGSPRVSPEQAWDFAPDFILFDQPERVAAFGMAPRNVIPMSHGWYLAEFDFVDD